jgi:DNA processing protein
LGVKGARVPYKNSQIAILANVCRDVNTSKHFFVMRKTLTLTGNDIPEALRTIPSSPRQLFCLGASLKDLLKRPRVAIVGSRGPSTYGIQVTTQLARELAEQGVVIVSGLAFGVDALAHQAALEAGGLCIAVLPGPLDKIYPSSNRRLAKRILSEGGALVSEYDGQEPTYKQHFIARNRLVAGLSDAILITEATIDSGSRHTADFAAQQDKPVLVVPGNINSKLSAGPNTRLKKGAIPITEYQDVLNVLKLQPHKTPARHVRGKNSEEQILLDLMLKGVAAADELLEQSGLDTSKFNQTLTMLEIEGKIRPLGLNHWSLS